MERQLRLLLPKMLKNYLKMKKLFILLFILLFSIICFSQSKEKIKKEYYINIGRNQPINLDFLVDKRETKKLSHDLIERKTCLVETIITKNLKFKICDWVFVSLNKHEVEVINKNILSEIHINYNLADIILKHYYDNNILIYFLEDIGSNKIIKYQVEILKQPDNFNALNYVN